MEGVRDPAKTPVNQRDRVIFVQCPNEHDLFRRGIKVGTLLKNKGIVLMESQRAWYGRWTYVLTQEQWGVMKSCGQRCRECDDAKD